MQKMKKLATVATLASAFMLHPGIIQAQSAPHELAQQASTVANKETKVTGLDLNMASSGKDNASTTLSETYLDLGRNRTLWTVGGQAYDQNLLINTGDFGLKYVDGKNLFRGTIRYDSDALGKLGVSYGFDTETYINRHFTILGDVSKSKSNGKSHVDFGAGQQVKFGAKNSVLFIYGDRQNTNNYRLGYLFDSPGALVSILADYEQKTKPVFTGFLSVKNYRFTESYDPNSQNIFTANIFAFGNKQLPMYLMRGLLKEQYILTTRTVVDSDNTVVAPASLFVNPKGKFGDFLRVNISSDPKTKTVGSAFIDNAFMIRASGNDGFVLYQNLNKNPGIKPNTYSVYYGAGIGYRFGRLANLTPVVDAGPKGLLVNLTATF